MECDSRDMFLSWQSKQNVKVDLWKWKCTHTSGCSDTVKKLKRGFILEICSILLTKWYRPEFLPVLVMPDRGVNFKIQTSVLSKVFFGRLTINMLVTKSEELWSCDKRTKIWDGDHNHWVTRERGKKRNGDLLAGSSSHRLVAASNLEWTPADCRPLKRWNIFSVGLHKC